MKKNHTTRRNTKHTNGRTKFVHFNHKTIIVVREKEEKKPTPVGHFFGYFTYFGVCLLFELVKSILTEFIKTNSIVINETTVSLVIVGVIFSIIPKEKIKKRIYSIYIKMEQAAKSIWRKPTPK